MTYREKVMWAFRSCVHPNHIVLSLCHHGKVDKFFSTVIELSDAGLVETGSCISTLNDHLPNVEAKLENLVSPSKQNHCVSSCYVNVEKGEIDSDEQSAPHPWKVRSGAGSKPAVRLLLPEDNPELFQFVSEAAAEVGVKLGKTEELSDGVAYPAAEKILLRVIHET